MTLADVLDLDVLRASQPQVLATRAALERPVNWIHVSDLPDAPTFVMPGDILLTHGLGLSDDVGDQMYFVSALAKAGAVAMLLEIGRRFPGIPPAVAAQAAESDFPIVAFHQRLRFANVTEQLHEALAVREYDNLARGDRIRAEFLDLAAAPHAETRIMYRLAGMTANPVIFADRFDRVLDLVPASPAHSVLDRWQAHGASTITESASGPGPSRCLEDDPACWSAEVSDGSRRWGRLHLLEIHHPSSNMDLTALRCAATALGLALASTPGGKEYALEAHSELVSDILRGRYDSVDTLLRRARAAGAPLASSDVVVMVLHSAHTTAAVQSTPRGANWLRDQRRLLPEVAENLRAAARDAGISALCAISNDSVIAITTSAEPHAKARIVNFAEVAIDRIFGRFGDFVPAAGISRMVALEDAEEGVRQAQDAAWFAANQDSARRLCRFDELGVDALLVRMSAGPELSRFVHAELGALISHDATHAIKLLPLLHGYLEAGESKVAAARAMSVSRRTLYYKLEQIAAVLDRSVDDLNRPSTRARLLMAVRGLEILRWGTQGVGGDP
jgi:purine catabolism regulator